MLPKGSLSDVKALIKPFLHRSFFTKYVEAKDIVQIVSMVQHRYRNVVFQAKDDTNNMPYLHIKVKAIFGGELVYQIREQGIQVPTSSKHCWINEMELFYRMMG